MTPEDAKFFEEARDMFLTPGWAAFKQELLVALQSINLDSLNSSDDFWQAKGRASALAQVLNWEESVKLAEEQQEADDAANL